MGHTRLTLALLVAACGALVFTSGCFLLEGNVKLNVDGSANVEIKMGIADSLADMQKSEGGTDPFADTVNGLPKGWTVKPLDEEGWKGVVAAGKSAPGEPLFPPAKGEKSDFKTTVTRRLFCTDYDIQGTLKMDDPAAQAEHTALGQGGRLVFTQGDQKGQDKGDPKDKGKGDAGPDMGGLGDLLGGMMGAGEPRVQFSFKAPGTVLETTGEIDDDGAAVWRLDMGNMMQGGPAKPLDIRLRTRLVNYQNVGRLADRLAEEEDLADMASLIAEYVTHDLLPNPPKKDPLRAGLDVKGYADAVHIIAALQDAVGAKATATVIRSLKLNADNVTGKQLADTWRMVSAMDAKDLADVAGEATAKQLRMRLGQ